MELTDPDRVLWADPVAVEVLAAELGIDYRQPSFAGPVDPCWQIFKAFRRSWAEHNGFADERRHLDLAALGEAGVYAAFRGPRYRMLPTGEIVPLRP